MDLSLFFDPLEDKFSALVADNNVGQSLYSYTHQVPELDGMHMALIGITESRGHASNSTGIAESADAIRGQFYSLRRGAAGAKIVDLGNLRNGPTLADTYQRIQEVGSYLLSKEIIPIFFGGTRDMIYAQYSCYAEANESVNMMICDAKVDLSAEAGNSYLNKIIHHVPSKLFQLYHLGHQSYWTNSEDFNTFSALHFEAIRLGTVKEKLKEMEPLIRDSHLMSFNLAALNHFYAPASLDSGPYGFNGEEACQLAWYAGLNDNLSSMGFYDMDADRDDSRQSTAFVVATMIWYFIEGYCHRVSDKDFQSENFLIYEVAMKGEPESIRFFKSTRSEKWWMEVPDSGESKTVFMRNKMVPCSYEDYEMAVNGEIPGRWLGVHARLS